MKGDFRENFDSGKGDFSEKFQKNVFAQCFFSKRRIVPKYFNGPSVFAKRFKFAKQMDPVGQSIILIFRL